MKKFVAVVAAMSLMMIASTAVADGGADETVYDFEGEDLTGSLLRPDGEDFSGRDQDQTDSLIDIREDFVPEMLESVESL